MLVVPSAEIRRLEGVEPKMRRRTAERFAVLAVCRLKMETVSGPVDYCGGPTESSTFLNASISRLYALQVPVAQSVDSATIRTLLPGWMLSALYVYPEIGLWHPGITLVRFRVEML